MIFFSPSRVAFFADELRAAYDAAGSWPTDAIAITNATWRTFTGPLPSGKMLGVSNGVPVWVDIVAPVATKPQQITATQFLNRIPPAALPVLWGSAQTGVMLITLAAANMIDLTDPAVQGGINALVPSILTTAQAAAILDH